MDKNDLTKKDVLEFYASKNRHYPITDEFMKTYKQKRNGYIEVANVFNNKGNNERDKKFFEWLKKNNENGTLGDLESLREINRLGLLNINNGTLDLPNKLDVFRINPDGETEPNQKWHFFISYYAYNEFNNKNPGDRILSAHVTCPELWLWTAEAAKDDQEISYYDIYRLYVAAVDNRNKRWREEIKRITEKIEIVIKRWKKERGKDKLTPANALKEVETPKHYFLTWEHPSSHDGDQWVAITGSMDDLKKIYETTLKESNNYHESIGLKLMAYEHSEKGFTSIQNLLQEK